MKSILPPPPTISILEESSEILPKTGFLRIKRSNIVFHYPDGSSDPFTVDQLVRKVNDSVGILAWFIQDNKPHIYLRSAIRPALILREYSGTGLPEDKNVANLWEIPAGGIEPNEHSREGILRAASRETKEELGFELDESRFSFLGNRIFLDVGSSGVRMYLLSCTVYPPSRKEPETDGSPMEKYGKVISVSLEEALKAIENGEIIDTYTEIGIRRLKEMF